MRSGQNQYALPVPMLGRNREALKTVSGCAHILQGKINRHEIPGLRVSGCYDAGTLGNRGSAHCF